MVALTKYKPEMCEIAQELLSKGKSLAAICREFKISRQCLYNWLESNPDFKESVDAGIQAAQAHWEDIGENGVVGNYEKFSAPTWIFTMKNRFREDYQEDRAPKTISEAVIEKLIDRLVE